MSACMFDDEARGRTRWATLTQEYPTKYAGDYPSTDEAQQSISHAIQIQARVGRGVDEGDAGKVSHCFGKA